MAINLSTLVNTTVPSQLATAWVNYNGVSGSIRNYYNVSSVTKIGTGHYRINFSSALLDGNYVFSGTASPYGAETSGSTVRPYSTSSITSSSFQVQIYGNTTTPIDSDYVGVVVFGN